MIAARKNHIFKVIVPGSASSSCLCQTVPGYLEYISESVTGIDIASM